MIIDFATIRDSYYTAEENDRLNELEKELKKLDRSYKKEHGKEFEEFLSLYNSSKPINLRELTGWKKTYLQEHSSIIGECLDINEKAKQRYKAEKGIDGILEDIRKIVEAYTLEDFQTYLEGARARLKAHNSGLVRISYDSLSEEETQAILESYSEDSYRNLSLLLFTYCQEPYTLLVQEGKKTAERALKIIEQRCKALGYERAPEKTKEEAELPDRRFFPVLHGRATDNLAKMSKKSLTSVNEINHTATLSTGKEEKEIKAFIKEFDKLTGSLGVNTHKLLMTGVRYFTQNNHTGEKTREVRETEVHIPLKEYATLCGYDIEAHAITTPNGSEIIEEKERQRAENKLKDARKQINKDLEVLYNASLSWTETVRGKKENYSNYRIIDYKGIKNGYINFNFAKLFSNYLISLPIGQYPEALLRLDAYKQNAYSIGLNLAYHLNNDKNIGKGTANRLKVKTILEYTTLPSIEEIRKQEASWVKRIKEPLETALDDLGGDYVGEDGKQKKGCNLLKRWEYVHSGGEPLTDEEAGELIKDYSIWEETLISFELKDAPDHTERLEAKTQRRAEAEAKKGKKPRKNKKGKG